MYSLNLIYVFYWLDHRPKWQFPFHCAKVNKVSMSLLILSSSLVSRTQCCRTCLEKKNGATRDFKWLDFLLENFAKMKIFQHKSALSGAPTNSSVLNKQNCNKSTITSRASPFRWVIGENVTRPQPWPRPSLKPFIHEKKRATRPPPYHMSVKN